MLIKTGTLNAGTWSFSDNEIAHSIDHAVAGGANIILLTMFGQGPVAGVVSTAINNARNADVLVIAPAGDVVDSFDGTSGNFTKAPVDITLFSETPASDPNVVSVAGTGLNKVNPANLPPLGGGEANPGNGWDPLINSPFNDSIYGVAQQWSNTGATMAGVGFGMGFGWEPYLSNGGGVPGDPLLIVPGDTYTLTIDRFGSIWAAAYVTGAASQVYQTLTFANGGTPPTDDEVLAELTSTAGAPITGTTVAGVLNAGLAMTSAINGGSLISVIPPIAFTAVGGDPANWLSQPKDGVTRGTDVSVAPTVINGTDPLKLTVDWGDETAPDVVNGWKWYAFTHTGGYANLGKYTISVTVQDANNLTATSFITPVLVINPLAATISIESATGATVAAAALKKATTYRFNANPANIYTGGGNITTFSWDFNGDGTEDATGPTPTFSFPSAGSFTVKLTVQETQRPDTSRTLDVTVSN